ncbi:MAG: hypothetical protein ACR2PL_21060 [Dehalococcoidia bacterium]
MRYLTVSLALFGGCLALACRSSAPTSGGAPVAKAGSRSVSTVAASQGQIMAQVTSTELVVGQNRFTLGLLDGGGRPIADATAHFDFFKLEGSNATLVSQADATFRAPAREANLPETLEVTLSNGQKRVQTNAPSDVGVYSAQASFDSPGKWGVEAKGQLKSGAAYDARTSFQVLTQNLTPAVGSPAPRSRNLTVKDVTDLAQIDSSVHPSADMHTETIAEGIAAGHPLLVLFATPGYCPSRFCGPELEVARKLEAKYRGQADFIHVEIYKDPAQRIPYDTVLQWHITSEPYFFIVDRSGLVRAKFEGPTSMDELDVALQKVAG